MLQGRVGIGKDGEYRHKDREGWKSHDQNTDCFPSVEMLFAGIVWLKYILLLVRFSYPSSSKRRLKPELARLFCVAFSNWEAWKCAEHVAVDQRGLLRITWSMCVHRSIKCVGFLQSLLQHHFSGKSQCCSRLSTGSQCGCRCAPDLLVNSLPRAFGLPSLLALQAQS